jgi:hypothetical protein
MSDGVDDDLAVRHFVENIVGIGRRRQAPNGGILRAEAAIRMSQQQVDNVLHAFSNAAGSAW